MATKIGEVFVDIGARLDPLRKGFKQAKVESEKGTKQIQSALGGISASYKKLTSGISLFKIAMATTFVVAIKKAVKAASDLQEVTSKFDTVFKDTPKTLNIANQAVNELTESYAMSTREARDNLATMQDLLKPLGVLPEKAAKLSAETVKLAADIGSFNNLPTADVLRDIKSAMVGNFETVRKYGTVLDATKIKQIASNKGMLDANGAVSAQTKALIVLEEVSRSNADALGDMIRTQDSFANRSKQLSALMEDMAATIGQELTPVLADFIGEIVKNKDVIIDFAVNAGKALAGLGRAFIWLADKVNEFSDVVIDDLADVLKSISALVETGNPAARKFASNIGWALNEVAIVYGGATNATNELTQKIKNMPRSFNRAGKGIKNFADELKKAKLAISDFVAERTLPEQDLEIRAEIKKYEEIKEIAKKYKIDIQKVEEAHQKRLQDIKKKYAKKTLESQYDEIKKTINIIGNGYNSLAGQISSMANQLSQLIGQQAQNRISILQNEVAQRSAILEEERLSALEQAGVEEETDAEKQESDLLELQNNLDRAVSEREKTRIKEQIKLKQDAIKRTKINTDFAKKQEQLEKDADAKKKAIEREAAKRQKQLAIFTTLVEIPTAAFQAFRSAQVLPFPASAIVGGMLVAAATSLGFAKLAIIQQTPLPMAEGGVVRPPGITAEIGEGKNSELVAPLNQKIFDMMGQGIINAIAARQEISPPEEPTIEEIDQQTPGIIGGDVYLDGDKVGSWITRGTEDATIRISSRAIVS